MPYATLTPKPPRKRTRKGRPDRRGRPASNDTVRIVALGRDYGQIRFFLSEDIMEKLIELYEVDYQVFIINKGPMSERYRGLRLQFAPFVNLNIPAILLRIEPPTYDPRGSRIRRAKGGRQFLADILCAKIRVKNAILSQELEHFWADLPGRNQLHGLIVNFHDDDMLFPSERKGPRDKYELDPNNFIVGG